MRKLFWQISVTFDGFMEAPNRELDDTAQIADPDFDRYASAMLQSIDATVLGRVTYQHFVKYWPSATGPDAECMNGLPKIVFSRTLRGVQWNNSRLAGNDMVEEITRLKQQPRLDIALSTLAQHRLIDEYRILVSPVVLGDGTLSDQGATGSETHHTLEGRGVDVRGRGALLPRIQS